MCRKLNVDDLKTFIEAIENYATGISYGCLALKVSDDSLVKSIGVKCYLGTCGIKTICQEMLNSIEGRPHVKN